MPGKLGCVDSEEGVDGFVKALCEQIPLRMFMRREIGNVNVRIVLDDIQYSAPEKNPCWCKGRGIDEEKLQNLGVAVKIKTKLMGGESMESGTA
ncbi:hypothetical protein ACEPPN_008519 [Leptodophora sp. 'Broadleaf-Isolate-01']